MTWILGPLGVPLVHVPPPSFHKMLSILETVQIPTYKPYIFFFLMMRCIKWHEPWILRGPPEACPTPFHSGWLGGAKVSCIICHRGVQLILAYSWARPAILVAGKGRGGMFLFLLFLHFHSCSSFFPVPLSSLRLSLLSLFSLSLGDDTKWPTRVDVSLNPNTINS